MLIRYCRSELRCAWYFLKKYGYSTIVANCEFQEADFFSQPFCIMKLAIIMRIIFNNLLSSQQMSNVNNVYVFNNMVKSTYTTITKKCE